MPSQNLSTASVLPVFAMTKNVPQDTSVYQICLAAERVTGPATVDGATCISGLWRIYPLHEVARAKLLTEGITINGKTISLDGINPFFLRGSERAGTRLTISNLPFSYGNDTVARNLKAAGVQLRSDIQMEKARAPDRSLTDWKTGRRFVWIDLPPKPLPRSFKMGDFLAQLFYREMQQRPNVCFRCLQPGHRARECENDEVCHTCKKPGHRRGDPECQEGFETEVKEVEEKGSTSGNEDMTRIGENELGTNYERTDEADKTNHSGNEDVVRTGKTASGTDYEGTGEVIETNLSGSDADDERISDEGEDSGETIIDNEKMAETTSKDESSDEKAEDDLELGQEKKGKKVSPAQHSNGKNSHKGYKKGKNCKKQAGSKAGKSRDSSAGSSTPTSGKKQQYLDSFLSGAGKRNISQMVSPNDSSESPDHQRIKVTT